MSTHNAVTANYSDVLNAYNLCVDGDTLGIPAGDVTWSTAALSVTKNISIIGAGEGVTIIRENFTRATNGLPAVSIFDVALTKESAAPDYSFRLSGMTLTSTQVNALAGDNAFIELRGITHGTDSPVPYVRGCVSRVRVDHITWDNLNGLCLLIDSVLGVADHITAICNTKSAPAIKCFMQNWTPIVNPEDGTTLPTSYLAIRAFGSWADDSYWGTDKFWFVEDCNFIVPTSALGICDDEEGGRVVYRHCTVTNGTVFSSHGMEGRSQPGVRAREFYNNNLITTKGFGQTRSGSVIYFNNKSTGMPVGVNLAGYRIYSQGPNWGCASGDNRYDDNAPGNPVVTGIITAVASPGGAAAPTITVGPSDDLSGIDLTDGSCYSIVDLDDLFTSILTHQTGLDNDPGWQFYQSAIYGISGKILTLLHTAINPRSAAWQVGHHYQIMKTLGVWGSPGHGKGNLLNTSTSGGLASYATWTYPATSGTKATTPFRKGQGGSVLYPLDPCYSWNNTDDTSGYLGFAGTTVYADIKLGVHAFNISEQAIETQSVGYPPVSYARATSDYPDIGEDSDIPYAPFTYPHPLTGATTGKIIDAGGPMNFDNAIIGGTAPTLTQPIRNTGDTLLTATSVSYSNGKFVGSTAGFTIAQGATHNLDVTYTPTTEGLDTCTITINADEDSGVDHFTATGTGVLPAGGGGRGKGHKKGVLTRRA